MKNLYNRLANLLAINSIVTLIATGVVSYMAIVGRVTADQFMVVYTMIIGFYFGQKKQKEVDWIGKN